MTTENQQGQITTDNEPPTGQSQEISAQKRQQTQSLATTQDDEPVDRSKQRDPAGSALQNRSDTTAVMQTIERIAMNPDADPAKLEKMLDMQERILDRNARMEFDAAMAAMQPKLPEVEKKAEATVNHKNGGGSHTLKYAKFDQILAAIKPVLKEHGFSITHRVKIENSLINITAVLGHVSGHREETTMVLPPDSSGGKNPVQAVASSTEYGRRYTMNALLGIATKDADVDGGEPESPQQQSGPALITRDQTMHLMDLIQQAQTTPEQFCKKVRINVLHELQANRYAAAEKLLRDRIARIQQGGQP